VRRKKLGYAATYSAPKKKAAVISWVQMALHWLRESTNYFKLLFDHSAGCFSWHRAGWQLPEDQ